MASTEGKGEIEKAHWLSIASVQKGHTSFALTDHRPEQLKWPNLAASEAGLHRRTPGTYEGC